MKSKRPTCCLQLPPLTKWDYNHTNHYDPKISDVLFHLIGCVCKTVVCDVWMLYLCLEMSPNQRNTDSVLHWNLLLRLSVFYGVYEKWQSVWGYELDRSSIRLRFVSGHRFRCNVIKAFDRPNKKLNLRLFVPRKQREREREKERERERVYARMSRLRFNTIVKRKILKVLSFPMNRKLPKRELILFLLLLLF